MAFVKKPLFSLPRVEGLLSLEQSRQIKSMLYHARTGVTLAQYVGYLRKLALSFTREDCQDEVLAKLQRFYFRYYKLYEQRLINSQKKAAKRQEKWHDGYERLVRAGRYLRPTSRWITRQVEEIAGCEVLTYYQQEAQEEFVPSDDEVASVPPQVRRRKTSYEREPVSWVPTEAECTPAPAPKPRSEALLARLRAIIEQIRRQTGRWEPYSPRIRFQAHRPLPLLHKVEATHETGGLTGEDNTQLGIVQKSNVVITEQRDVEEAVDIVDPFKDISLVSDDIVNNFDSLCGREQLWKTLSWATKDAVNAELLNVKSGFPAVFIRDLYDTPLGLPFRNHQYGKCDIEIRVQVTAIPFMSGRLQVAWYYLSAADSSTSRRNHMAAQSQMLHATLDIGTASSVVLRIPFRYYKKMMHLHSDVNKFAQCQFGHLYIKPLTKLRAPTNADNSVSVNIYVSLHNCEFTGTIPNAEIVGHEMDVAAGVVAANMIKKYIDRNYDNASAPIQPTFVANQSMPSWSIGSGQRESINEMRLEHALTPITDTVASDPLSARDIAQKWGLVTSIEWKQADTALTSLVVLEASPILKPETYYSTDISYVDPSVRDKKTLKRTCYFLPPCAVVSSCFEYYTGNLELRFEVVGTRFHQGKLLCVYIPGQKKTDKQITDMGLSKLVSYPCAYFDYKPDSTEFNFIVPYISDVPFQRRFLHKQEQGLSNPPHGYVYLLVLNSLVVTSQVGNAIDILVYMRGGPTFEVSVPAQPVIGLSDNVISLNRGLRRVVPLAGSESYYPSVNGNLSPWNPFMAISGANGVCVFMLSQFFNTLALFTKQSTKFDDKTKKGNYCYYLENDTTVPIKIRTKKDAKEPTDYIEVKYFVPYYRSESTYLLPVVDKAAGKYICQLLNKYSGDYNQFKEEDQLSTRLYSYWNDNADGYEPQGASFVVHVVTGIAADEEFDIIEAEHEIDPRVEENVAPMGPGVSTPSSSRTGKTVTERHDSLKNILRRWQYYTSYTLGKETSFLGETVISFPVCPQGLDLNLFVNSSGTVINQIFNRTRNGLIPIIMNGFRGYRGSVRFRVVLSPPSVLAGDFFVQHFPAEPMYSRNLSSLNEQTKESIVNHFQHGNAYHIQSCVNNNMLTFEIPYYLPYEFCLTQAPYSSELGTHAQDVRYAMSLGEVRIGFFGTLSVGATLGVFYSLGDDATPVLYQGFEPMMLTQSVEAVHRVQATHETGDSHEMFGSMGSYFAKKVVTSAKKKIESEDHDALATLLRLAESGDMVNLIETTKSTLATVRQAAETKGIPQTVLVALSSLMHVANNPTPSTMAIAFGTFLLSLGILTLDIVQPIVTCLTKLFDKYSTSILSAAKHRQPCEATSQIDFTLICEDRQELLELGTLIVTGMCGAVSLPNPFEAKDIQSWLKESFKETSYTFRFGSSMFHFFKPLMDYITRVYYRVCKLYDPDQMLLAEMLKSQQTVQIWVQEVLYLTDVALETYFDIFPNLVDRVNSAYVIGGLLVAQATKTSIPGFSIIKDLYNKILKLRTELLDRGVSTMSRREPWIVWVYGPPGIGKSYITNETILACLSAAGITSCGSPIYNHAPAQKWWDNCHQEPAVVLDDAFVMRSGELSETEQTVLMSLKSPALFTPPIAECDRKKKRYSPDIVYLNSNTLFPEATNMSDKEALYRRRDMLVQVDLTEEWLEHPAYNRNKRTAHIPEDVLKRKGHLRIQRILDGTSELSERSEWMSYEEWKTLCKEEFVIHYKKQVENVNRITRVLEESGVAASTPEIAARPLDEIINEYVNSQVFTGFSIYKTQLQQNAQVPEPEDADAEHEVKFEMFDKVKKLKDDAKRLLDKKRQKEFEKIKTMSPEDIASCSTTDVDTDFMQKIAVCTTVEEYKEIHEERIKRLAAELLEPDLGVEGPAASHEEYVERGYNNAKLICSHHMTRLERYFLSPTWFGQFAFGMPARFKDFEAQTYLVAFQQIRAQGSCRHWSMAFNYNFTQCGHCCYTGIEPGEVAPHNCRKASEACSTSCVFDSNWPIPGKSCNMKNCVLKSKFAPIFRRLVVMLAGTNIDLCRNLGQNCPDFLVPSRTAVAYVKVMEKLSAMWTWIKEKLKAGFRILSTTLGASMDWLSRHKRILGSTAMLITALSTVIATNKLLKSVPRQGLESASEGADVSADGLCHELVSSGDPRTVGRAARLAARIKVMQTPRAVGATHESGHYPTCRRRVIAASQHMVAYIPDADGVPVEGKQQFSKLFFVGERYAVTTKHAIELCETFELTDVLVNIATTDTPIHFKFADIGYTYFEDSSLCLLRFPAQLPKQKNIINLIATEADHALRAPTSGSFMLKVEDALVEKQLDLKLKINNTTIGNLEGASTVNIVGLYTYKAQQPGYCATVLMSETLNAPVFAMHIAGNKETGTGYAEPLVREMFLPALGKVAVDIIDEPIFKPACDATLDLSTQLYPIGSVPKKYAFSNPVSTNIHQSAIFDYIPHKTEPAPLVSQDPRLPPYNSPLIRGCEKHGILTENFPRPILDVTEKRLSLLMKAKCKPIRGVYPMVLSDQQAVCGDNQLEYCKPLQWSSSEGYPFRLLRPAKASDKKWLFDLEEGPDGFKLKGYHPYLSSSLATKRAGRARGEQQVVVFTDCLKDARIGIEKCSKPGKTRVFSMAPVDYTIEFRKYFYDFIASYQSNSFECLNAIGINPFGEGWNQLANLLKRNEYICTGDYSNFGPGLNEEVAFRCCRVILEWYNYNDTEQSAEDKLTRECLLNELINAKHLAKDLIYEVGAGVPSGSPITVVLNSLVNTFYLFAAWEMMCTSWPIHLRDFRYLLEYFEIFTYGDDFIMSVPENYKDLYNAATIAEILGKYKIKLTDAFKGETITPYATLEQSTFLKGHFVYFSGKYWYGLEQAQIEDIPNWVNSRHMKLPLTIENCHTALYYAHGWGREYFEQLEQKLSDALLRRDHAFLSLSFDEITLKKLDMENVENEKMLLRLVG